MARSHIDTELNHLAGLGLPRVTEAAPVSGLSEERARSLFPDRIFFGDRTSPERMAAVLNAYETAARGRRAALSAHTTEPVPDQQPTPPGTG